MVKSDVSLLALGKMDFKVIEPFRADQLFQEDMSIGRVPSNVWLRQRLETLATDLRED